MQAVKDLFAVHRRGIIFFDDMDIALRDRNTVKETDDQAVFLSALDGIDVNEGVVYVFTTNCPLELIDPAFKRPGRIDLVLHFELPTATLRRELIDRWHAEVRGGIDIDAAVDRDERLQFRGGGGGEEPADPALHRREGVGLGLGDEPVPREPAGTDVEGAARRFRGPGLTASGKNRMVLRTERKVTPWSRGGLLNWCATTSGLIAPFACASRGTPSRTCGIPRRTAS